MAEVTIGTNDFPVFSDVDFADVYLSADVARAAGWALRQEEAKARGLVSATRRLLTLPWCATAPDPSVDPAPTVVQEVTAMLAADLLEKPALFRDASGSSNVKSAKAGSAQVEFFSPVEGGPAIPKDLWDLLLAAELVCGDGAGDIDVTLDGAQPFGTSDGYRPLGGRYPWDWPIAALDYD